MITAVRDGHEMNMNFTTSLYSTRKYFWQQSAFKTKPLQFTGNEIGNCSSSAQLGNDQTIEKGLHRF